MDKELTEDITGAASRIQYGKKGEKVKVIKQRNNMVLVQGKQHLFYVRAEKLTDIKQ